MNRFLNLHKCVYVNAMFAPVCLELIFSKIHKIAIKQCLNQVLASYKNCCCSKRGMFTSVYASPSEEPKGCNGHWNSEAFLKPCVFSLVYIPF